MTYRSYHDATTRSSVLAAVKDQEWQNAALNESLRRLQEKARPDHFAAFVETATKRISAILVDSDCVNVGDFGRWLSCKIGRFW